MDEWYSLLANNVDADRNPLDISEWSQVDLMALINAAEAELTRRHSSVEQRSARMAHNHEVEGSNPSAATTPQAPICKLTVASWGPAGVEMYTPGLPAGDHELYCEPEATAPYLRDQP